MPTHGAMTHASAKCSLIALVAVALLTPGGAAAQQKVVPVVTATGGPDLFQDGRIITATGQSTAVGRSVGDVAVHIGGWVRARDAGRSLVRPTIFDVYADAVTPDAAVIVFETDKPVTAKLKWGLTPAYEGGTSRQQNGNTVRVSSLTPGELYHYQLLLEDEIGNEVGSQDFKFCTPSMDELVNQRVAAAYFEGTEVLGQPVVSRLEATIDQPNVSGDMPEGDFGTGLGAGGWSARWHGIFRSDLAASYYWRGTADDGQRLTVDAVPVFEQWSRQDEPANLQARLRMDRSWHAFTYEYFHEDGDARATLMVDGPGVRRAPIANDRIAFVNPEFFRPTIEPRDEPLPVECASPLGTPADIDPPEVFDCRDPAVAMAHDGPRKFPYGETRVVWTATNAFGRRDLYAEIITIEDSEAPTVYDIAPVTAEATSPLGSIVSLPVPRTYDRCDDDLTTGFELCVDSGGDPCSPCQDDGARSPGCSCEAAPGRFPMGSTTVTAVVTDRAGLCDSTLFDVVIEDTTPPQFDFGEPRFVCRQSPIPPVTLRDNASATADIDLQCSVDGEVPGDCDRTMDLALGRHYVTYYATDEAGNRRVGRLDFTVQDEDPEPPTVRLLNGPTGYIAGNAVFDVEVLDNCDANPALVVTSPSAVIDREGRLASITFSAEGLYNFDVRATDATGNVATVSDVRFGIDRTAPRVRMTGVDEASDRDDPFTFPVFFPGDSIQVNAAADDKASDVRSGLAQVTVALTHRDSDRSRTIHRVEYDLDNSSPAQGPSGAKNLLCADQVPDGEETWCDGAGELIAEAIEAGDWDITVSAVDAAGNASSSSRPLTSMSWRIAMDRAEVLASRRIDEGVSDVAEMFLRQLPDRRTDALRSVDNGDLMGNGLLYGYTFVTALDVAQGQGVDMLRTREWLAKAVAAAVTRYVRQTAELVGENDGDIVKAQEFLVAAREQLIGDPPSYQASTLESLNAFFHARHAADPVIIIDAIDARLATRDMDDALIDYLAIEDVNGRSYVEAIAAHSAEIRAANHWLVVDQGAHAHPEDLNVAYIQLLYRLNEMARLMANAQDDWVWVRQWQWTLSQQVKLLADQGLFAAAVELGVPLEDPEDPGAPPADPVLAFAYDRYNTGLDLVGDRLVDDVGELYVDSRCLIYEVYNYAGFVPAAEPPEEWECDECVLTGDCGR